jgi:predicted RNA-binding Zn-ribbon protein involved in translation (DUF1610 family)
MSTTRVDVPDRLRRKRCLDCGHDGALVQDPTVFCCPRCGSDLYARPPMSYAEMEGFEARARPVAAPRDIIVVRRGLLGRLADRVRRMLRRG